MMHGSANPTDRTENEAQACPTQGPASSHGQEWSVYMLRDQLGSLYTGITTDVSRRFDEHVKGGKRGAKYTRARKNLVLVYRCSLGSRSLAARAEYRLKRCRKAGKESIIEDQPDSEELMVRLGLEE
jgi:putative endonuclease